MGFLPLKYKVLSIGGGAAVWSISGGAQYLSMDKATADGLFWAVGPGFESQPDHDERDMSS